MIPFGLRRQLGRNSLQFAYSKAIKPKPVQSSANNDLQSLFELRPLTSPSRNPHIACVPPPPSIAPKPGSFRFPKNTPRFRIDDSYATLSSSTLLTVNGEPVLDVYQTLQNVSSEVTGKVKTLFDGGIGIREETNPDLVVFYRCKDQHPLAIISELIGGMYKRFEEFYTAIQTIFMSCTDINLVLPRFVHIMTMLFTKLGESILFYAPVATITAIFLPELTRSWLYGLRLVTKASVQFLTLSGLALGVMLTLRAIYVTQQRQQQLSSIDSKYTTTITSPSMNPTSY